MTRPRVLRTLLLILFGLGLVACSGPSDLEVAEDFTAAFVEGDLDALESMSTGLEALGAIPWRAGFLSALDLEAESSTCVELGTSITCTIVGHNARTRVLVPDSTVKRSLHLTVDNGVVTSGSFEFGSPELLPVLNVFNEWVAENRADLIEGPCADIDGTSDPAACAAAVLEATAEYLEASDR